MSMFVRTNSIIWGSVNQSDYKDSIVFIEDTEQIYSNGIYYGGKNNNGLLLEKITFSEESILLNPDKFYASDTILETLDITLNGDTTKMYTYFVKFLCDNTCVILPSNIKWKNNIVPDFTKTSIMTIKIQDDTAYLIDCRPLYSVQYTATEIVQPNRTDAFGSEIVGVTEDKFILNSPATEIKENAFEGNQDLISITIPNTVKSIGCRSFANCPNLEEIRYEGTVEEWSEIDICDTWKEGAEVEVKDVNGQIIMMYKTIDLGLPSGLLFADRLVGASNPGEPGLYFQWGDTVGYSADQVGKDKVFNWNNYKYCNGSYNTITKYCAQSSYGTVDNKTALELEDDAAHVNMGPDWRMPTRTELQELINNTNQIFEDVDGNRYWKSSNVGTNVDNLPIMTNSSIQSGKLKGLHFLSRTNFNSIFIPACGYCNGSLLDGISYYGYLWSSSLYEDYSYSGGYLYFYHSGYLYDDSWSRYIRLCILGVKNLYLNNQ